MQSYYLILVMIVVIPFFFWFRVRSYNKRKNSVAVRCPYCSKDQRISELEGYTCSGCNKDVKLGGETYLCKACGASNYKGVITCTECGLANPIEGS